MKNCLAILALITLGTAITATDYCSEDICNAKGATHVACDSKKEFSSSCPKDAEMMEIDESLQKLIVDKHNEKRNTIAGGEYDSLKPACRMATIEWDDELAYLAEFNVLKCKMEHDDCHNTNDFKYSGQNLGEMGFRGEINQTERILQSIDLWYEEKEHVSQSIIDEYPNDYSGPDIGHFTVMMADRNIRVGCAAATYSVSGENYKNYLLACNYATTNMIGFAIYKSCDKPAADCESGTNESYKNLCSPKESYDVNQWF
ncbi:antigen 5 like allergen Cul n 1-like [Lucilia sericata]|uniref:antigen 5 like allergen Cul n 1-like n=1 Tax=Lucilia sericata TaxID=13632 RepID=UPI0018A846F2|nr:antigen 5 like allergen Cul n 1-like [Lucilia sericata]